MPQRMPVLMLALLLSVAFPAPSQSENHTQPSIRPVQGAEVFREYCAACHGANGRGKGPASAALNRPAPDLTRLSQRNGGCFPLIHVRSTITLGNDDLIPAHGSKEIPMWGPIFHEIEFDRDFGSVRLENVTKYLESLQRK